VQRQLSYAKGRFIVAQVGFDRITMKYGILAALGFLVPCGAARAQEPVLIWNHAGYAGSSLSAWTATPAVPGSLPSVQVAARERPGSGPALARVVTFETDCERKTARTLLFANYDAAFAKTSETALSVTKHQSFADLGPVGSVLARFCTGPSRQTLLGSTSDALRWLDGTTLQPAINEPRQLLGGADQTYVWKVREISYGRSMAWATGETSGMKLFFVATRYAEQQQADGETHALWGKLDTYQLNCESNSATQASIRNFDKTGEPAGFIVASASVPFAEGGSLGPALAEACGARKTSGYATMTNWGGVQTWLADLMVRTAKTYPLPATVKVREAATNMEAGGIEATWTRRGASNIYDGVWTDLVTGETSADVLEWRTVDKGKLTIYREGNRGIYTIPVTDRVAGRGVTTWASTPQFYVELLSDRDRS